MRRALVLACCLAGCVDRGPPAVELTMWLGAEIPDTTLARLRRLDVFASGVETAGKSYEYSGLFAAERAERVVYYPAVSSGELRFFASAWDTDGDEVARGETVVALSSGTVRAELTLGAGGAGADLGSGDLAIVGGTDLAGADLYGADLRGIDPRTLDSDGDTISDFDEGSPVARDSDADGTPDYLDLDTDGDCVPDAVEAGDADPATAPVDTDNDGKPDVRDADSDSDGLPDRDEDQDCDGVRDSCEPDRRFVDSDGDGTSDLLEHQACVVKTAAEKAATNCACDAATASAGPSVRGELVFLSPSDSPPVPSSVTAALASDTGQADFLLMLDTTGSMGPMLSALRANASAFGTQLRARLKSPAVGVMEFRDFPGMDGTAFVLKYNHRIQTNATSAGQQSLLDVINALAVAGGGDTPEAGWEALYAIAGGLPRIQVSNYDSQLALSSTPPVPATVGEQQGALPGAGFRAGSLPVVVAITDALWHDAPGSANGSDPESGIEMYDTSLLGVPSRRQAVTALQQIGARVVSLTYGSPAASPKARLAVLATETFAVAAPADFTVGGARPPGCAADQCCTGKNGIGEAAVSGKCALSLAADSSGGLATTMGSGVGALLAAMRYDVHAVVSDVDPGTVDKFVQGTVPNVTQAGCLAVPFNTILDNFSGPRALAGSDGVADTMVDIAGGQQVCIDLVAKTNLTVPRGTAPQSFRARLILEGRSHNATVTLGTRDLVFVVPAK